MALPKRHKDANWTIPESADGTTPYEGAQLAVLMDIRDELKKNNRHLATIVSRTGCYRIPRALDALHSMGVAARRRKRKVKRG